MVESDLRTYLLADAGIAALITSGTLPARLFADVMPQNSPVPSIVYQRITSEHPEQADGTADLKNALFQISIYATTRRAAEELAELIIVRMLGMGGSGFQKGGVEDERSSYENDTKFFRQDVDFRVFYN